jgi:hypothetical protein
VPVIGGPRIQSLPVGEQRRSGLHLAHVLTRAPQPVYGVTSGSILTRLKEAVPLPANTT